MYEIETKFNFNGKEVSTKNRCTDGLALEHFNVIENHLKAVKEMYDDLVKELKIGQVNKSK